jgi:hypothetical protein
LISRLDPRLHKNKKEIELGLKVPFEIKKQTILSTT